MVPPTTNVLILALAKTGSTGLYSNVKSALVDEGHDPYCLFEPTRPEQLHSLHRYAPELSILTKVMIAREPDLDLRYERFAKRVTLLRDPRDMVVSFLLFRPFVRADVPWEQVEPFVAAVREKEQDPTAHSVESLQRLADDLDLASYRVEKVVEFMERQEALIDAHDLHTVRYEDFIAGRLDDLSAYLGVAVDNRRQASPWLDHILRAAGSGDWRHWFTAADVDAYRPHLEPYMRRFGYADEWALADRPAIDPATASDYIEGKYRKRFAQQEQRRGGLSLDVDTAAQRAKVEQLAADGNAHALHRLAKAEDDDATVFWLTYRSAVQGYRPAMRMLANLYRHGRGVAADASQASFWRAEAESGGVASAGGRVPHTSTRSRVRRLLRR